MNDEPKEATREQTEEHPSFVFFRATPVDVMKHPPLASSLQTLETCFLMIALRRFPSALVLCASARESVLKAKLGIAPERDARLEVLIEEIQSLSGNLRTYSRGKLHDFRQTRNRVTHHGYSPADDEICAVQLLETGFPFLDRCYRELFDFYLDWHDIAGERRDFGELSAAEAAKAGLLCEIAEHYRVFRRVYLRARELRGLRFSYCFLAFGHYFRLRLKQMALTEAEEEILTNGEEHGVKFERERDLKQELGAEFGELAWEFNCPICGGYKSMVGELAQASLEGKQPSVRRCGCAGCGFVVPAGAAFLADELLRKELDEEKPAILKGFGIR